MSKYYQFSLNPATTILIMSPIAAAAAVDEIAASPEEVCRMLDTLANEPRKAAGKKEEKKEEEEEEETVVVDYVPSESRLLNSDPLPRLRVHDAQQMLEGSEDYYTKVQEEEYQRCCLKEDDPKQTISLEAQCWTVASALGHQLSAKDTEDLNVGMSLGLSPWRIILIIRLRRLRRWMEQELEYRRANDFRDYRHRAGAAMRRIFLIDNMKKNAQRAVCSVMCEHYADIPAYSHHMPDTLGEELLEMVVQHQKKTGCSIHTDYLEGVAKKYLQTLTRVDAKVKVSLLKEIFF